MSTPLFAGAAPYGWSSLILSALFGASFTATVAGAEAAFVLRAGRRTIALFVAARDAFAFVTFAALAGAGGGSLSTAAVGGGATLITAAGAGACSAGALTTLAFATFATAALGATSACR